jgi:hypothetical protein
MDGNTLTISKGRITGNMIAKTQLINYLLNSKAIKLSTTRHEGAWGERMYSSYSFKTSALDGGEWSASRPGRAIDLGKGRQYPLYRGWVGHRAGLDTRG